MLPLLQILGDGGRHTLLEVEELLAKHFGLSDETKNQMLASGNQRVLYNRIGWARTYLNKGGLLENVERGVYKITERGQAVLKQAPEKIDREYLERFDEFKSFQAYTGGSEVAAELTPEEDIERSLNAIAQAAQDEILERLHEVNPAHFEQVVIDVLVAMGYGGSHEDAAKAVGKSGDGGIDGVINEDRLGLDTIYIQAKRWQSNVGRPEVQSFAGALSGNRATKGVLISTSDFTNDAKEYIKTSREKIILIDGKRLAALMYEFNVGVSLEHNYQVKRIDTDYFLG